MSLIISIEGNIGSGKSTILQNLKNQFINEKYIIFLEEPVNEWTKVKDNNENIIEKFYQDSEKYSFPFQMLALFTRFKMLNDEITKNPNSIIITERCLFTDKYIFSQMLFDTKKMNSIEYQIYNKWFDEFTKKLPEHKFIYLESSPKICLERIKKRSRDGEQKINLKYLEECSNYHNLMFNKIKYNLKFNLDNCEYNSLDYNYISNKIRSYILEQNVDNNYMYYLIILVIQIILSILVLFYF